MIPKRSRVRRGPVARAETLKIDRRLPTEGNSTYQKVILAGHDTREGSRRECTGSLLIASQESDPSEENVTHELSWRSGQLGTQEEDRTALVQRSTAQKLTVSKGGLHSSPTSTQMMDAKARKRHLQRGSFALCWTNLVLQASPEGSKRLKLWL